MVPSFLPITIGMVIRSGWVVFSTHITTPANKQAELIDGGDMSLCWTNERWNKDLNEFGGATINNEGTEYGPQYYSQRGEDCPLVLTILFKNICLMVKNMLTSSAMVSGYAMIRTSLMITNPNSLKFLPEHLQYD